MHTVDKIRQRPWYAIGAVESMARMSDLEARREPPTSYWWWFICGVVLGVVVGL